MMKLRAIEFSYTAGERSFSVSTVQTVSTEDMTLEIWQEDDVLSAVLHAEKAIRITRMRAIFDCPFEQKEQVFLNGYQSWTDSTEHGIHDRMLGIALVPPRQVKKYALSQYGDYRFARYTGKAGELHGYSYGYIRNGNAYRFFGSLAEDSGFTVFYTNTARDTLIAEKDCTGLNVRGDYTGLHLLLTTGTEKAVFDSYFSLLGIRLRESVKPVFGYTSWYRHYQNISEKIILEDLRGMQSQPYRADVFQIDDGYQTAVGDWLSIDAEKFPEGMAKTAADIRAAGYLPGIWLAPFAAEENSRLWQEHPDWVVRNDKAEPVKGGSNWSGFYALDICNPEVREYLRGVFRTVIDEWGYGLLKLDFLYAACIQPRPDKTRGQLMAEAMDFLRECAGDALILGCGVPLASAFGRVDYCRIGCDVGLDWDDKPHMRLAHRERVSTKNAVLNSVFRRQLNGRAFLSDPDVFLLRSDNIQMTAEQRTCLAEVNALCGSVLFTSDNAGEYGEDQRAVLSRIMKLRDAEILSAKCRNGLLKITFRYHGKLLARIYPI